MFDEAMSATHQPSDDRTATTHESRYFYFFVIQRDRECVCEREYGDSTATYDSLGHGATI